MADLKIEINNENMNEALQKSLNAVIAEELGSYKIRDIIRDKLSNAISDRVIEALSKNIEKLDVEEISKNINESIVESFVKGAKLLIVDAMARSVVNIRSNGYMSQIDTDKQTALIRAQIDGSQDDPKQGDLDIPF